MPDVAGIHFTFNEQALRMSLQVLGPVAAFGTVLPAIDRAWETDPDGGGTNTRALQVGIRVYLGAAVTLGALATFASKEALPFVVTVGFALVVVGAYERAFATHPEGDSSNG